MKTVTIADLKNNLSRYLREVRHGERFTVMSRDVPVAELSPLAEPRSLLEVRPRNPTAPPPGRAPLPDPMPGLDPADDALPFLLLERGER